MTFSKPDVGVCEIQLFKFYGVKEDSPFFLLPSLA